MSSWNASLYQQCLNAIELSKKYVGEWLKTGMFKTFDDKDQRAQRVVDYLANHNEFKSHGARVGVEEITARGVDVKVINDDPPLFDAIMTTFHAVTLTFGGTGAFRIIENSRGAAYLRVVQVQQVPPSGPHTGPGGGKKKR